jgi:hypothetical protein
MVWASSWSEVFVPYTYWLARNQCYIYKLAFSFPLFFPHTLPTLIFPKTAWSSRMLPWSERGPKRLLDFAHNRKPLMILRYHLYRETESLVRCVHGLKDLLEYVHDRLLESEPETELFMSSGRLVLLQSSCAKP